MIRRVYSVRGFDCALCASKVEEHLNKKEGVTSARIDYAGERLYLVGERDFLLEEIRAWIAEAEEDEILVCPLAEESEEEEGIPWLLWVRIAYCVAVFFLCGFAFRDLYWVRFGLYTSALVVIAYDIAWKVGRNLLKRRNILDENLLMLVASVGALVLASVKYATEGSAIAFGNEVFIFEEHFEAVLVCLLYQVGELAQDYAVKKSRHAIERAVDSRPEDANLFTDEGIQKVSAKQLKVGDKVFVALGDKVPVDGIVYEGAAYGDASSLTGEALPISLEKGSHVYAGTIITGGEAKIEATSDYSSSASAKILDLVSSSLERKGKAERFITRFAKVYTPVVFLVAIVYALVAGIMTSAWRESVFTGLEILVISCPCALVISVPLAYFAAIGLASRHGIVIKGASFLDALYRTKTVVSDKTGTLTKASFRVKESTLSDENKRLLVSLEAGSSHPLALAIASSFGGVGQVELTDFAVLPGFGVMAKYRGEEVAAGNKALLDRLGIKAPSLSGAVVHLAKGKRYCGYVLFEDEEKENAAKFVKSLQKRHISLLVLSGDSQENVDRLSQRLGIESSFGGLLPEDKLSRVEKEKERGTLVYLGDGINDAPCLAQADIGVAMGGLGADMAVEEADVVLLQDDPMGVIQALRIASMARRTIVFNIAFALASKAAVLALAIAFKEKMPMEVAVFADTGVALLLTLNSLLLLCRRP